jgi:hypothetical protein
MFKNSIINSIVERNDDSDLRALNFSLIRRPIKHTKPLTPACELFKPKQCDLDATKY